ncbi:MAG: sulfatase [Verrucomicrobia bacterium]|nr:sulfatase [Verrucomicrobiota bacterium]MCH8528848.1 sulfatase [Kiritimatiellia bacterium]
MTDSTRRKPNILWIFGDQHRAQALSIMGDPNVQTPNIDRLATEGVHFTRAVATNPWCCPFRFSLTTGLYPHKGIDRTPPPAPLDPGLPTVATLLKASGYQTSYVGKWHLYGKGEPGSDAKTMVIPRENRGGFDSWIGYENNNSQYDTWVHGHRHDGAEVPVQRLPRYETDALTDLLLAEIDRMAQTPDQPFFGVLSVQPPHVPNVAPPEDMARHNPGRIQLRPNVPPVPRIEETARRELAGYYAQIENLDRNLGRVLEKLREQNLLDDTLILFFSDHGDCMGSHGFREKSSPWEESIRIPFIIGGGVPYKNRRYGPVDAQISAVDILPTTLGLADIAPPDSLPGFDYSGYLNSATSVPLANEPDSCYIQHTRYKKLADGLNLPWRGVVTRDGWKYVCIPDAPFGMWNLNEDPFETANLVFNQRFIGKRRELHARLARWIEETGDAFDLPEIPD